MSVSNERASVNMASVLEAVSSHSGSDILDDDYDDTEERQGDVAERENQGAVYRASEFDYDVEELASGLDSLLGDLQLESRITERYKYKLMNKFNFLLQALVSSHEKEFEIIEQLQTKRKILTVLNNFVKSEEEISAKLAATEDKPDDDQDQGMDTDLNSRRSEERRSVETNNENAEGEKPKGRTDSQGLSVEEMTAGTIRDTLLHQKNRLDVLEAIKRIHVLKLKQKEFEKTLLTLHYSKMVKPADFQKEMKEVKSKVNDLQLEISAMHQDMGQIQMEVRTQEKAVVDEEKLVEKLELEALTKQNEVALLQNRSIHIQKEGDREAQKLEQLQDMYSNLCQKELDGMENFRIFQSKIDKLNSDLNTLIRDESRLTVQKKNSVREIQRLMAQMEALMTREQIMLDRAALMVEKIHQATKLKRKIHEEQQKVFNEASKALRISQRLDRSIRIASEAFVNARLAHDKMRSAFDASRPSEEDSNWQRLGHMLEREIQTLKTGLGKKLEESNVKASMVERLKEKLNELYDEQITSGKQLQELIRTTVRKRREREEKSEQCIKLDGQIQRFDLDIKIREVIIEDCKRTDKDLVKQIAIFQHKCGILKLEKSAIVNDVVVNKHKLTEARLVLKTLEAQVKAVNQRILDWEKEIKSKHYLILNARLERDSIRNDALRNREKFRYHRKEKDELLLGNKTLRRELERQKQDIAIIRKRFETAISESNNITLSVRERIEEICTFTEYIHIYDKILLRGGSEITIRELERTKLCSLADELRKHVLIVKMNQPDESVFFKKIERLRQTFYDTTERRRILEQTLNEDENPLRVREIKFGLMKSKENVPHLENKLDVIEELLASRYAIGLERTLLENHIAKIADDTLTRALHLKDTYGEQVKSMVNTRKKLSLLSRKIDGFICENSIASAQAETAETLYKSDIQAMKLKYFRKQLAEAEANFQKGLPPNKDIEAECVRLQWRKKMTRRAYQKRSGFLRPVQPKKGYQVKASRLRNKSGQLENPGESPLGWWFSAVSRPNTMKLNPPLIFCNKSAVNPRKSSQLLSK